MSRDPFDIGKIDSSRSIGQGPGASPLGQVSQQAALARVGEGAAPSAPAAPTGGAPPSDKVQFSSDVDDGPRADASANLLGGMAAWGAQPPQPVTDTSDTSKVNKAGEAQAANGGFSITQAPPPGMGGGALGPNGLVSGQAGGMAAGGVFTTPPRAA